MDLIIPFQGKDETPLYEQIYRYIKSEITVSYTHLKKTRKKTYDDQRKNKGIWNFSKSGGAFPFTGYAQFLVQADK